MSSQTDESATELFDEIEQAISGYPANVVVRALGNALANSIAFMCDAPEEADEVLDKLPGDLKAIVRANWTLVTEARRRALGGVAALALFITATLSGCAPPESAAPRLPAAFANLRCAPRAEFIRAATGHVVWSGWTLGGVLVEIVAGGSEWGLFITPEPGTTCHVTSGTRPAPIAGTPL